MTDRRKQLLAQLMVTSLRNGDSVAKAEAEARATQAFDDSMNRQGKQLQEAHRVVAEWHATMASYEAARSLLSMQKESMRVLEG
jgi:hypothetical protein